MIYNSLPSRKRNRLKGFNYSSPGHYFITICVNENKELFWDENGELNAAGCMIYKWLLKLEDKFNLYIDCWTIMPNHIHAVIVLKNNKTCNNFKNKTDFPVGADLRVCPNYLCASSNNQSVVPNVLTYKNIKTEYSLSDVIAWFKTMTTNEYIKGVKENGWIRFNKTLWQRSFYDHIIRNDRALDNIREYISTNPDKWISDAENTRNRMDKKKYYKNIVEKDK